MKLHKKFINELAAHRKSTVGEIIVKLRILEIEDNSIQNLNDNLDQLDQIFYTVDYLMGNDLVTQRTYKTGSYVPDFNPMNFIKDSKQSNNEKDKLHAMPEYLQLFWGRELLVLPAYFKMIDNGYKTDQEKKDFWQFWLPILAAFIAAMATGLFTKLFDIWLQ